jgi:nucleoid DNA-binding protein
LQNEWSFPMPAEDLSLSSSSISPKPIERIGATSRTVTRHDIATAIMQRLPALSRREAQQIFECALQEIAAALSERGECVKLHEFGTFFVRESVRRIGHDPLEAEGGGVRRRKTVNFRPSLALKQKVEKR